MSDEQRSALQDKFQRAVGRTRAGMIWERLWPKLAPVSAISAGFLSASFLGLWAALPPLATALSVATTGLIAVVSPFFVKSGSLKVSRHEAMTRINDRLDGAGDLTVHSLSYQPPQGEPLERALWQYEQDRLWQKWGDKIKPEKPDPVAGRFNAYALHAVLAVATFAAALSAGDQKSARLASAFDWQPDPSEMPMPPPLAVEGLVTPPAGIDMSALELDATTRHHLNGGDTLYAYQNSTLILNIYEPGVTVSVNNEPVEQPPVFKSGGHADEETGTYRYEIPLTEANTDIHMWKDGRAVSWHLDVMRDLPPSAHINAVQNRDGLLEIDCSVSDDHGVTRGTLEMMPENPADSAAIPLPSADLPPLPLDALTPCGN